MSNKQGSRKRHLAVVAVSISGMLTMKSSVSLNLPRSLEKSTKDGVSVNQYIALALAEKIGARGTVEFFAERSRAGDVD